LPAALMGAPPSCTCVPALMATFTCGSPTTTAVIQPCVSSSAASIAAPPPLLTDAAIVVTLPG
jgi:hypothetical protein